LAAYVALLRGINVTGRNKIAMSELRPCFEALGHTDVRTYIQSGNVVFATKAGAPDRIGAAIEKSITATFGLDIAVLVRTRAELATVLKHNPFGPEAYVTFLDTVPARARVAALDPAAFAPDEFAVHGREVFVRCPNGYGRTKINNTFFERKLGVRATTRNWKTVTTLSEWAAA